MFVRDVINQENTKRFTEFMKEYGELEYQKSFAGFETVKHPLRTNGLISTYDLFQDLMGAGEPVENIKDFLDEYGDFEIIEDSYDNTYNYNGYLDRYVEFHYFELENDQVLVTLSVCLGLDPRSAYTKNIAMVFESEYDFLETFSEDFQLLDFEFTDLYGKKYYGSFDAGALSELGYLNITDPKTNENIYYDEASMDTTDTEDISDTVAEIMETETVEIGKISYFWESNF